MRVLATVVVAASRVPKGVRPVVLLLLLLLPSVVRAEAGVRLPEPGGESVGLGPVGSIGTGSSVSGGWPVVPLLAVGAGFLKPA